MFNIKEDYSGDLKRILITGPAGSSVSIVPEFGANINDLILEKNGKAHPLLAGNRVRDDFSEKGVFNGAKLVPFPNRIKDGAYTFEGKRYQLEQNYPEEHNACHGFIYDREFMAEKYEQEPDSAYVTLVHFYDGSLAGYPFEFKIELDYTLNRDRGFSCRTRIKNLGGKSMPVGDGWHPFFTFRGKIDTALLRLHAERKIDVDDRLIPTGSASSYGAYGIPVMVGNTAFDTCFKIKPGKNGIQTTELHDKGSGLTIQLWQETGENKYNYIQVFIPPDRSSIALEPATCNINAFNNLEGLIILKPAETYEAAYGVRLL